LLAPAALAAQSQGPQPQGQPAPASPPATEAAAEPEVQAASAEDPNETVCRREAETGSRLAARRICRTRAQWEAAQRELRNDIGRAIAAKPTSGQ
jgi:hypothetical protein